MKKLFLFTTLFASTLAFSQTTYSGNGNNKFGGAVGLASLTISETSNDVSFSMTKGPGVFDSIIVFYIELDTTLPFGVEGISTTANFNGSSTDIFLAAVTGHNPATGRAVLNFPADFHPNGAVVFNKDSGRIFVLAHIPPVFIFPAKDSIQSGNSFSVVPEGNNSAPTYTLTASKDDLGFSGTRNFKFVGTYIGKSASRSDEAFGDPFESYGRPDGTSGFNPYTITSYFTFTSGVLPVRLVDFKAAKDGNAVNISWFVEDETNIEKYEVQRSTDAITFTTIASVAGRNSTLASSYTIKDVSAQDGINYYRLVITERGKYEISKVVSLNIKGNKKSFAANYTSSGVLNIILNNVSEGAYKLRILNNEGQLIQQENLKADGRYQNLKIPLKQSISKGIYRVALQSATARYTTNIFVPD